MRTRMTVCEVCISAFTARSRPHGIASAEMFGTSFFGIVSLFPKCRPTTLRLR